MKKVYQEACIISNMDNQIILERMNNIFKNFKDSGYETEVQFNTASVANNVVYSVMILGYTMEDDQ